MGSNPELTFMKEKEKKVVGSRELFVSENPLPIEMDLEKKEKKSKKFRIRSKRFFLTYPQLPKVIDDLEGQVLKSLRKSFGVKSDDSWDYLLSIEKHEDGMPHAHVYLSFPMVQGVYSRDKLTLTLLEKDGNTHEYEGQYEAVKNHHHVIQYVLKSVPTFEDVVTNMNLPLLSGVYYSSAESHIHAVIREIGLKEANRVLIEQYPDLVIKKGNMLLSNMETVAKHYIEMDNKKAVIVRSLSEFENVPSSILDWMSQKRSDRRTLVLYGPPGTGKTEIAKAILYDMGMEWVLVRDINVLRGVIMSAATGLIFDDFPVYDKAREEMIHLLDTENPSSIRILYGTAEIPAKTPKIFTTNRIGQFNLHDEAINRRVTTIEIPNSLWVRTETTTVTKTTTEISSFHQPVTLGTTKSVGASQTSGKMIDAVINTKPKRGRPKGSKNKPNKNNKK